MLLLFLVSYKKIAVNIYVQLSYGHKFSTVGQILSMRLLDDNLYLAW